MALQPDGKLVAAGGAIARLNPDGSFDPGFQRRNGPDSFINATVQQDDGKLIVGGAFIQVHDDWSRLHAHIARFNVDGALDTSFDPGPGFYPGPGPDGAVESLTLQPDGKILIAGVFTNVSRALHQGVARLNSSGQLDSTFDAALDGVHPNVHIVCRQPDNQIIIGGEFASIHNTICDGIARLNPDGTLDSTFNTHPGYIIWNIRSTVLQPDGHFLLGGGFAAVSGLIHPYLARLDSSGGLDSTFAPTGPNAPVTCLTLSTAGKFYTGGLFTLVNDVSRGYVARMFFDTPPLFRFQDAMVLADKSLQLTISAPSGSSVRIDASTNLANWTTITNLSVPAGGSVQFVDQAAANLGKRYYRGVSF